MNQNIGAYFGKDELKVNLVDSSITDTVISYTHEYKVEIHEYII